MGTRVGRIVKDFVLRAVLDSATPAEMRFHKNRALCRIVNITDEVVELEILEGSVKSLKRGDTVHVFMHFQNNHHTFESTCVSVDLPAPAKTAGTRPRVSLQHPAGLVRDLQRKHERIRVPAGLEVYFVVRGQRVDLGFPRTRKPAPQDTAAPPREPAGEAPGLPKRLDELVQGFKIQASDLFSTSRISMFRDRQPSTYEENLVSALGSILWLATVEGGLPETEPVPDIPIVTLADLRAHERVLGTAEDMVDGRIATMLISKRAQGIHAEATSPILYGDYVLGCVQVANLAPRRERITEDHLRLIWDFSRVLSSALERHRYVAAGAAENRRYDAAVIDISPTGLLFRHPSGDLALELLVNTDLQINLAVEGRTIPITARIRRKFTEPGEVYYGVQFAEIAPEDSPYLFRCLYGRPPTEQDDRLWEGGAPPPRMDLFGGES